MDYAPHFAATVVVTLGVLRALWHKLPFMADEAAFWLAAPPPLYGSFVTHRTWVETYTDDEADFVRALIEDGDAHHGYNRQAVFFCPL